MVFVVGVSKIFDVMEYKLCFSEFNLHQEQITKIIFGLFEVDITSESFAYLN